MNKKYFLVSLFTVLTLYPIQYWSEMRTIYTHLLQSLRNYNDDYLLHPYWKDQRILMKKILQGAPDRNVLLRNPIAGPMLRQSFLTTQQYELVYLNDCISTKARSLIKSYQDTNFGGTSLSCSEFKCSINTLGQLFFFAKVIERNQETYPHTIIELGGGYGCLARIFKTLLPDITYVIYDLPEYLSLQFLYLSESFNSKIKVHYSPPQHLEKGMIHLVPTHYIQESRVTCDLFLSMAALSETTEHLQKLIVEKKFFNANSVYVSGGLHGHGKTKWPQHNIVINGVRENYQDIIMQPLHHFFAGEHKNYEIYAKVIK